MEEIRTSPARTRNFWLWAALLCVAIVWIYLISFALFEVHRYVAERPGVRTNISDFSAFWAASVFAWNGTPLAAFDTAAMRALQANGTPPDSPPFWWLYPPAMMMLLMPLGALSFIGAWVALVATSVIALFSALARLDASWMRVSLWIVFSPATLICLARGQLAMLFAAALVLGFAEMMRRREARAAMWLSFVTLKPSLCVGFPIAFAASRSWRLIGFGLLFMLGLSVAPLPVVGFEYWTHWREAIRVQNKSFLELPLYAKYSVTWAAFFINLGLRESAVPLQWGLSGASFAMLALVWASGRASIELRAAALMFAMVSALPYGWVYEALYPLVGAMFLLRESSPRDGAPVAAWRRAASAAIFVGLWLMPLAAFAGVPVALAGMPLCFAALTCSVVMARAAKHDARLEAEAPGARAEEGPC